MITSPRARFLTCCAATLLLLPAISALAAAPQAGTYLEIESESGGDTQLIELSMQPDRLRIDSGTAVSLVSIGGDDGKFLMIQHPQQQYIELDAEMMQMMAQMMPDMPQAQGDEQPVTPPTFTRTGNTKQVGEWSAYEVLVEHPEQDADTVMWMSQDVDADFQTMAETLVESMSSMMDNPMMQMGGGGGGISDAFAQVRAQMNATEMPDGFPVQIISNAGGTQTTNTLRSIDQNAAFGPETWEAPAGYTKVDMPRIR